MPGASAGENVAFPRVDSLHSQDHFWHSWCRLHLMICVLRWNGSAVLPQLVELVWLLFQRSGERWMVPGGTVLPDIYGEAGPFFASKIKVQLEFAISLAAK